MKSWVNSKDYIQQVNSLSVEDYAASVSDSTMAPLPEHLTDWLARLRLLYGLPFDYLVPDERLLPPESIRFFYIDRNWTDRMVDGALSVGKTTSREFSHHHAVFNKVMGALDDEERNIRTKLRETKSKAKNTRQSRLEGKTSAADMTGFLFRSQAVSGWTGLEVKAYRGKNTSNGTPLRLLRMDRLGPDILLCLFDGIPDIVDIEEPREGIQFGVQATLVNNEVKGSTSCPSGLYMKLRHMTGKHAGYEVAWKDDEGEPIDGIPRENDEQYTVSIPVRKANPQVLHIEALKNAVKESLDQIEADNPGKFKADTSEEEDAETLLTAAEFSVQMLQFPYQQRFQGGGKQAPSDNMPKFEMASQYKGATIGITTAINKLSDKEIQQLTNEAYAPVPRRGGQ